MYSTLGSCIREECPATRLRELTDDYREYLAYTITEAAHYLAVPPATIRNWTMGRGAFGPLIEVQSHTPALLSFLNLTELHVLAAIRREHQVNMHGVRKAIQHLAEHAERAFDKRHPLISHDLETDGPDLVTEYYGDLVNGSQEGQTVMREIISAALHRIERDNAGVPIKLYPFTRSATTSAPTMIVIDPRLSGGRPVINGTGLAIQFIAERYKAGESIRDLANDYGCRSAEIEEAIRYELQAAA